MSCVGRIQTSPGVLEIGDSPTEYYRTVGAIIALLACYSSAHNEEFGLECVSAGQRGPMSLDQVPGKFINMGNKKAVPWIDSKLPKSLSYRKTIRANASKSTARAKVIEKRQGVLRLLREVCQADEE